jgi:filamentous hemagglutinin family protein
MAVALAAHGALVEAAPAGLTVLQGSASMQTAGTTTTLLVSSGARLCFASFDVAAGEEVVIRQTDAGDSVQIQVVGAHPTRLQGALRANGSVVLALTAGLRQDSGAVVRAAGFTATTAAAGDPNPDAGIVIQGRVEIDPLREIVLRAATVENRGALVADAGRILIFADVASQAGLIQANTVGGRTGTVEIRAAAVTLAAGSQTLAKGPAGESANGGQVVVVSGGDYHDAPSAQVSVAAGELGGDGGRIELSASNLGAIQARLDAAGGPGGRSGSLLLDPSTITLATGGAGSPGNGNIGVDAPGSPTINPEALTAFTQITLEARNLISVNAPLLLPDAPGGASLTLRSGGNIQVSAAGAVRCGRGWNVQWIAGATFATPTGVASGVGSVVLNGPAAVSTVDGTIQIVAGHDVTVQQGFIHSTGGGAVAVNAGGSINAGTNPAGFDFGVSGTGYSVDPGLGGISTAAGGDVTLTAGGDVTSLLPTLVNQPSSGTDAGSGAFGQEPGNVTITAGGGVFGHYVLANGAGVITATGNAGTASRQLALSLVRGSWTVTAGGIVLQEVRNPNGMLNGAGNPQSPNRFRFDYDPASAVTLNATGGVVLLGATPPRLASGPVPILYPGSLTISAGAEGVAIGGSLTLFPSPVGQLSIVTRDGGGLFSDFPGKTPTLAMSDAAALQYTGQPGQFGLLDHASTPVHAADPVPVSLNVAGDLIGINLVLPKPALLTAGGNVIDSSLFIQNLHPTDLTEIQAGGLIENRAEFTFYSLPPGVPAPDFSKLADALPPVIAPLQYIPATATIACRGPLSSVQLDGLLNLQIQQRDASGHLILDGQGNPVLVPYPILPADLLNQIYLGSQGAVTTPNPGIQVGGPGLLAVRAKGIQLGLDAGIVSVGPGANPVLAAPGQKGADIHIASTGDLSLISSAIVSEAGGSVLIEAGGRIDVGAPGVAFDLGQTRGIYSTGGGNVTVTAGNDVEISGSRIAAYNGGSVMVRSQSGSIDAGSGGSDFQQVSQYSVDPATGGVLTEEEVIPGAGILATTFADGLSTVGNISIQAPRGNVIGGAGGIEQIALNGTPGLQAVVTIEAGTPPEGADPGVIGDIRASVFAAGSLVMNATGAIVGAFVTQGGVGTPPVITIARDPILGSLTLTWTDGTLQQSDAPGGPFTAVAGTSPLTLAPDGERKFYRAVK